MKKINILLLASLFMALFITSCEKEPKDDGHTHEDDGEGTIALQFAHEWGMGAATTPFALNTELVHPMTGDTLNVSTLKFYISNLKLKDIEGNWWSEEESYHLVDASIASSNLITLTEVPAKHYVELSYTIGVDSARNVAGAQTGALSPSNDMFWSWNSGYIMTKIEGVKLAANTNFAYHCGGFVGANNSVRVNSTDFGGAHLMLSDHDTKTITITTNPARFWHSTGSVDSFSNTIHMPNSTTSTMMDDYSTSFTFESIQ